MPFKSGYDGIDTNELEAGPDDSLDDAKRVEMDSMDLDGLDASMDELDDL